MEQKTDIQLLSLAPELIEQVIKQIEKKKDLANTRLACKTLEKHASKELFKEVHASLRKKDQDSWNSITQDDFFRRLPRHLTIETNPGFSLKEDGSYEDCDDRRERLIPVFKDILNAMSNLPNLESVEILFDEECHGSGYIPDWIRDVDEDRYWRNDILYAIFGAIEDRLASDKNRKIHRLTINHLQNDPLDLNSTDLFSRVMSHVQELHITFTVEHLDLDTAMHFHVDVELETFPPYFCKEWLAPVSANLTALSIYATKDKWGPFPGRFEFRDIPFPNLERLALGDYVFAHDYDLDWILAIKSLKQLIMHSCMIVSLIHIPPEFMERWNIQSQDWTKFTATRYDDDDEYTCFEYDGKWSQYWDRIGENLPNLLDFRFDCDHWIDKQWFMYRCNCCGEDICVDRYIIYDQTCEHVSPFCVREEEDRYGSWFREGIPINKHDENWESDKESMDILQETIKKRRSFKIFK